MGAAAAPQTDTAEDSRAARAREAREKAATLLREQKFNEAKRALDDAEKIEAEGRQLAEAQMERDRASAYMAEGKYAEARQALERADRLETAVNGRGPKKLFSTIRSRIRDRAEARPGASADPVAESLRIVSRYSKIAAGVGLLPGGLVNFAAILTVQVIMVSRIGKAFGQSASRERIRGVVLSLFGSAVPTLAGHGAGLAIASIPALIAGTIVYFIATPVLAYALTRAVGNTFTMHFESGGTLLTFDPKKFGDYFLSEFQKAGGTVRNAAPSAPAAAAQAAQ